jgi:F0F1-type ATP synthase delta subunit
LKFNAGRWASAFLKAAADDWEAGYKALLAFSQALSNSKVWISGDKNAEEAAAILGKAVKLANGTETRGILAAKASLALLVRRGFFKKLSLFAAAILNAAYEQDNVLLARLEAASEPEPDFLDKLKRLLIAQNNCRDVSFELRIIPELIAGYRITINGERYDFSLKGMAARFESALQKGI